MFTLSDLTRKDFQGNGIGVKHFSEGSGSLTVLLIRVPDWGCLHLDHSNPDSLFR